MDVANIIVILRQDNKYIYNELIKMKLVKIFEHYLIREFYKCIFGNFINAINA